MEPCDYSTERWLLALEERAKAEAKAKAKAKAKAEAKARYEALALAKDDGDHGAYWCGVCHTGLDRPVGICDYCA